VRHCGAGKTLECRRRWINAEGNSVAIDLVQNESVQFVFNFVDTSQVPLPLVAKGSLGLRLEISGVLPDSGRGGDAAGAHAGVVAQPALVQVGMVECLDDPDSLFRVQG